MEFSVFKFSFFFFFGLLQDYSKSLHCIGRCASVEQFWSLYCHLVRPSTLKPYRELHLFKSGIKPMWEDPSNVKGGKWVIRLRKTKIDRAWENACMAMLGEQFLVGPEICGIVLSTRFPVSTEDKTLEWPSQTQISLYRSVFLFVIRKYYTTRITK